ncbi:hypothetical protein C8Q75DRAFT_273329 [Abortiporus biennis]|nr:hypothetical protein C8Q75DRAFT_273329 [Abortiporus biennis]
MSATDLHEATFQWPHPDASDVILTGTFDGWSRSVHLSRDGSGFQGSIHIPWGQKVSYKYIVDGRWTTTETQPTESDPIGNVNNVYTAPPQPKPEPTVAPPTPEVNPAPVAEKTVGQVNGVLGTVKEAAVSMVEAIAPGTTTQAPETPLETSPAESKEVAEVPDQPVITPPPVEESKPAEVAPTPTAELSPPEAVLPTAKETTVASNISIPILRLGSDDAVTQVNGGPKELEHSDVAASASAEVTPASEINTHTPVNLNGATPTPPAETSPATEVSAAPATPSKVSEPEASPVNVPLPTTPKTNGKVTTNGTTSTPSSPNTTPHKEKRMGFPTLGRNHRRASSSNTSFSEHGEPNSPGRTSTVSSKSGTQKKKRTSSIFGKIKDIFHHDEHHQKEKK